MNKVLTEIEMDVIRILHKSGHNLRAYDISRELDVSEGRVSRSVSRIRKKFNEGVENAVYIYLTKDGYTLNETSESLSYESELRLKRGTSLICNGKYVFQRYKALSVDSFNSIKMKFFPKINEIKKI